MEITNYFFVGGNITAAFVTQGTEVPVNKKRKITSAIVCNDTAVDKTFTVRIVGETAATPVTVISALTIGAGKSYLCPELVGRGMGVGGYVEALADVTGMDFKFEAFDITNG